VILAAILAPQASPGGWAFLFAVLVISFAAGLVRRGSAHRRGLVGAWVMLTVVFGVAPWIVGCFIAPSMRSEGELLSVAGAALKTAATCGIALFVISPMGTTEIHRALAHLPLPRTLKTLSLHILHQTGLVIAETRRVHQAIALRTASSGLRSSWLLLRSLPQVWLSRVVLRSERVAYALELRGTSSEPAVPRRSALGLPDWLALSFSAGLLILGSVLLR